MFVSVFGKCALLPDLVDLLNIYSLFLLCLDKFGRANMDFIENCNEGQKGNPIVKTRLFVRPCVHMHVTLAVPPLD